MGEKGKIELPDSQPAVDRCDRPLVTFALFAYNQEKYIREAVEGAFSQTYQPLEIILSDDCSTDRTFELMKEMADAYVGPHKVRARKTTENRRVLGHVLEVAHLAAGELIVLAAGDDISKAGRVSEIVRVWTETGAWALHSRYDVIDAKGRVIARNTRSDDLFAEDCGLRRYFHSKDGEVYVIHGATSAYQHKLFELLPKEYSAEILSEDGVLSVYLNAHRKRAEFIEDSLILYRQHDAAITNYDRKSPVKLSDYYNLIKKQQLYSQNILNRAILFKNCIASRDDLRPLNEQQLQHDIIFYSAVTASLFSRLKYFGRATIIGFAEGKLGSLIPGVLGTTLPAFYLFLRNNVMIKIRGFRWLREASSHYLSVSIWLDFLSRKIRLHLRRLVHLGEYVELHRDANVSLSASVEAGGGAIRLKKHCLIDVGVILRAYGGSIEIGECSTVGPYSVLYGGGKLVIGNYVRIGPQVKIFAANHAFQDGKQRIIDQGMDYRGICIEDDVWIGAGACILDGVTLHKGTVVAAGAVVTKSTEAYSITAGVPARIIGRRSLS